MAESGLLSEVVEIAAHLSFRTADLECNQRPGEVDKGLSFFIERLQFSIFRKAICEDCCLCR